ncbi:hypothetical protein SAMN04489727_2146 [Amycolatopsis tolypomycina]|uniref:Uncharacterized protein n=1 Tax=Amycolatopsis tolypomycina TaxID=208445 RepID=A0A1H4JRN3_9PSEU|nr:hypothetical protein [Amycolatopsis tolypomycina]SEB28769.1 hypothetical protein SAMN04489727_0009 [Amycolatopsis tolypomycina]SEB49004.1 hypothetical protein SAMN04489727_2146 [Amycolatopsis tolypomycina]
MRNARPSRRQIEAATDDLDFDYFADTTGLTGDGVLAGGFEGGAELVDLYAEMAEIEAALAELEAPVARVYSLPVVASRELGEVA